MGDYTYSLDKDGQAIITGYQGPFGDVSIPQAEALGKTAYYKIIACKNSANKSGYSKAASAYVLETPTGIQAKASQKAVTVSGEKVAKASGYEVYQAAKKNGTYKKVAAIASGKAFQKTFRKMKKGIYYYKVRAYQKSGGKKVYTAYSKWVKAKVK